MPEDLTMLVNAGIVSVVIVSLAVLISYLWYCRWRRQIKGANKEEELPRPE